MSNDTMLDFYDEDYDIDPLEEDDNDMICEFCGSKMKKYYEHGEAWGAPYTLVVWECPNCD